MLGNACVLLGKNHSHLHKIVSNSDTVLKHFPISELASEVAELATKPASVLDWSGRQAATQSF